MPLENTEQRTLAAIMFTDMVGYSALSQRNEALSLELLEEHRIILRGLFPRHQGTEIKTTGDGFLVEFASALAAVRCAVEIQQALAERNRIQPAPRHLRIRIGIHVGDVVRSAGDVHGDGVNIAARIEPLAEPGGICISNSVHDQIENKIAHTLVRLRRPELKNIQASVQVYKLVLDGMRPPAPSPPHRRRHAIALGAVALLVLSLLLFLRSGTQYEREVAATNTSLAVATPSATTPKSIAVLPFVNMSADKADEYLSDGMTEELLNLLAKVKGLRVPGRASSFAFKGKNEEGIFRKVGEQLHVTTVLEGSVRKAGDKLRITAQLINVADGFQIWSETYDGDMKDILDFQNSVAQRVVNALQVQLGVEESRMLTKKPTENPEAYRLYLLGRYHFAKGTAAGWTDAAKYYNEALRLDKNYALAYCGLADNYGWMGLSMLPSKDAWAAAKELAQKALELDPDLADAHLSLGLVLANSLDWRGGEKEIKRSLELNPNLALAHDQYALLQICFGRIDEGLKTMKKAVELDPLSPLMNCDLAFSLYLARRYDEAIAQARTTLDLDPNYVLAHYVLGWCFVWKGDMAGAIMEFQKTSDFQKWPGSNLGYAYAISGDRAKAEQVVRDMEAWAKQGHVSPGERATIYLGLGEKNAALDWLEKSHEEQDSACQFLKVDPRFDSLRDEPRFQTLLKKIGLNE